MKKRRSKFAGLETMVSGILLWLLVAAGCTAVSPRSAAADQELFVFAATSLTDAFTELGQAFEAKHAPASLTFNFAGSSQLAAQLREGAVADIFASANEAQMAAAVSADRIEPGTVEAFATNRLSLIVPADNPAEINALADLARPGVRLILAAPGVPIRAYSDLLAQTLDPEQRRQFYNNLVSEGQNVRQVVAQIALGEADAGIVYGSDITPSVAGSVRQIPLPEAQHIVARYPLALVADAPQPALARQFVAFVLSAEGQTILARWGFRPPSGE